MRQARYRFFLLPLFFVLACVGVYAQANSELDGIVTDQTGAVVSGAKVTLVDPATAYARTTVSGATGLYDINGLNPANYNLKITAKGFQSFVQNGIVVNVSSTVRVDIKLTVGAEIQTVTVQANALAVQSDSNVISTLITSEDISSLATENRNIAALAALGLGVTNNLPDSNQIVSVNASWAISFNGLSQAHNVWMLDGTESYDRGSGGKSSMMPSQDAIAEFQVLASNYPPDYGISTGGTITMSLKSGTQKYHGTLFEENRNTDYNANTFFNHYNGANNSRPPTHYNVYGGNVGGPLFIPHVYNSNKQKTFFFWNEEWRKTTAPFSFNGPAMNGADIPKAGTPLKYVAPLIAPSNTIHVPSDIGDPAYLAKLSALGLHPGDPFPNNTIDPSLFDPNGVLYLNSGVIPTATLTNGNVQMSGSVPTQARDDVVRFDHHFNDKWTLIGHYVHDAVNTTSANPELGWLWFSYPTITSTMQNPSNSAALRLTGAISPNLLVEGSINYDMNMLDITNSKSGQRPAGWANNPVIPSFAITRTAMPGIQGFGGPYWTAEDTGADPYHNAAADYEPKLDISYTMGKHALKFGFSYNRYTKNQIIGGDEQGNFGFGTISGDGLIDMLLGVPTGYNQEEATPINHWVNQTPSVYAMDNWHVTPRLTLQLGLRYDALPHAWERNNYGSNFVPENYLASATPIWAGALINPSSPSVTQYKSAGTNNALYPFYTNGLVIAGQNGTPRGMVKNDYGTLQPRVGFSEDLFGNGKTVLRAGFGTFFERIQGNDIYNMDGNAPFANNLSLGSTYFSSPGTSWRDGTSVPNDPSKLPVFTTGLTSMTTTYKPPASAMFSLGVQREVSPSIVWVVQYVGNIDWHQNIDRHINNSPLTTDMTVRCDWGDGANDAYPGDVCPASTLTGFYAPPNPGGGKPASFGNAQASGNIYRQYQGYTDIAQEQNTATATYNSLQTGLRVQNRWGLSGEVDYTYSHQIDSTNNSQDLAEISNPFNDRSDKGSGALDRRHALSVNYVYKLPFFAKETGLLHMMVGGWEIAGTFIDNTGLVNISGLNEKFDTVGLGGGYANRPNISGKMSYNKKIDNWFDTTKLSVAVPAWLGGPNQGFGNAGKDAIVGPGRVNFTTSLYKTFAFTEHVGFQLKFESFNTFNHTEFQSIDTTIGDGNYGKVTGTWDPRNLQLGGRFIF